MSDHFYTIDAPTESLLKEKSSKFYAFAYTVEDTQEVEQKLEWLRKQHLKARHYCYAYIIGADKDKFRTNDDGEPSGTAGRPILGQIEKNNLTNTLVVVVRYFGGTKLGTSGLIKAYKGAAALALEKAVIVEKFITSMIVLTCNYENIGTVMNVVSSANLKILDVSYEQLIQIKIEKRQTQVHETITLIKSKMLNRSMEDITEDTEIEGMSFEVIE